MGVTSIIAFLTGCMALATLIVISVFSSSFEGGICISFAVLVLVALSSLLSSLMAIGLPGASGNGE